MDRRHFIKKATATALTGIASIDLINSQSLTDHSFDKKEYSSVSPRAITMWDFSCWNVVGRVPGMKIGIKPSMNWPTVDIMPYESTSIRI